MNQLVPINSNVDAYRTSTDAAGLCRDIVVATASTIQGRKFVSVEGWQAIAIAHGCTAGARDVERVEGGVRAIGEIRRMSDGAIISVAEGFVGEDEPTWYGGQSRGKTLPKRPDYAIRAMAQTRAISRACRSAFAHVVVMMKANLETTPAEEVPSGGFDDVPAAEYTEAPQRSGPAPREKLEGKHSSKTALQTALKAYGFALSKCMSAKELMDLQTAYGDDLEQARRYLPAWLDGDPDNPDSQGLIAMAINRKALVDLLDEMRECETQAAMDKWAQANGDTIDGLTDSDRRTFEAEWEAHGSARALVATANT